MNFYEQRLKELNLVLPSIDPPIANYSNYTISNNLLFISGQTPLVAEGIKHQGKVGVDLTIEEAYCAAQNCALQLIAIIKDACKGDFDRLKQVVKITAMVATTADFTAHPAVVNGCSDLLVAFFGERGRHARFSIGVTSLPDNAPVEIEMIAEIKQ